MKICASQMAIIGLSILVVVFILGVAFQQPILQIASIIVGVVDVMAFTLSKWWETKRKEKLRQEQLIIEDLEKWMEKTTFAKITYHTGQIGIIGHREPKLDYLEKAKKILKKQNAYVLWERGKENSKSLKEDGAKAIQNFHSIIEKALENIPLKKTLLIETLLEPYYSFPEICGTIFKGGELALSLNLDGLSKKFSVDRGNGKPQRVTGFLNSGVDTLAWGDVDVLESLRGIIENLNENKNVRKEIDSFDDCKRKLDSRESFSEFEGKLDGIIAQLRWNQ